MLLFGVQAVAKWYLPSIEFGILIPVSVAKPPRSISNSKLPCKTKDNTVVNEGFLSKIVLLFESTVISERSYFVSLTTGICNPLLMSTFPDK